MQRIAKPVAVELFSGAGGLSLGFELAGFSIVLAVEQERYAAATYRHNHPDTVLIESDVQLLDPIDCLNDARIDPGCIDAVICGLPCQGFSESNRRTRTLSNPRNHLYVEFLRFVSAIKPAFVVLENVAGMKTMAGGEVIRRIVERCEELGYAMASFELNAADFGVPQFRRRLFLVGSLDGPVTPPTPTHGTRRKRHVTVKHAISDLPVLRAGASLDLRSYREVQILSPYQRLMRRKIGRTRLISGHCVTKNSPEVLERFRHVHPGQNWEAIPANLMANYRDRSLCHTGLYYRLPWGKPSKVVGNYRKNMLIHPSQNRSLSVREAARLQSFPDHYDILGPMGAQQQQVADAVPPLLAKAVADLIVRRID